MHKFTHNDVKTFTFDEIKSENVATSSKFKSFSFQTIHGEPFNSDRPSEETIRQERTAAQNSDFKFDDTVMEFRGLSRQEQNDTENRIEHEVQKRLKAAFEDAYREGLEKGKSEGREHTMRSIDQALVEKMNELATVINDVKLHSETLLQINKIEIQEFIRRFTKWILMKEVNEKTYLTDLLERLILELNARKNLIVKVGSGNFSQMPEVIAAVETKLGQLVNVRIEIVPELKHPGIILESENGLIDGSLEGVFETIDKIFSQVNSND
jgi:flagellar assembly protein FliH